VAPLQENRPGPIRWAIWISVAAASALLLAYLLIWYGPDVIARHDVGDVTGQLRIFRLQQARDAARGRLLTLGAGLFAAGALIFTAQNYRLGRRTLEVAVQGQVTDRYTRAIEQLGSKKLDVRIGGIFGLERVAHDSARDHPPVMEVLAAFVREHSREQWSWPAAAGPAHPAIPRRAIRPDVQAALTVIGRRHARLDRERVDLTAAVLPFALLLGADLSRIRLVGADLSDAVMHGALLVGTNLTDANLSDAELNDANLTGAILTGARLEGADLTGARIDDPVPAGWIRDAQTGKLRKSAS
jgi:hypothetical protein